MNAQLERARELARRIAKDAGEPVEIRVRVTGERENYEDGGACAIVRETRTLYVEPASWRTMDGAVVVERIEP